MLFSSLFFLPPLSFAKINQDPLVGKVVKTESPLCLLERTDFPRAYTRDSEILRLGRVLTDLAGCLDMPKNLSFSSANSKVFYIFTGTPVKIERAYVHRELIQDRSLKYEVEVKGLRAIASAEVFTSRGRNDRYDLDFKIYESMAPGAQPLLNFRFKEKDAAALAHHRLDVERLADAAHPLEIQGVYPFAGQISYTIKNADTLLYFYLFGRELGATSISFSRRGDSPK